MMTLTLLPLQWRTLPALVRRADKTPAVDADVRAHRAPAGIDDETRWVRLAQDGDPVAFRSLVERHQHAAYETALRIVRSPEEAEEAAQDAFVRAWKALPGFREDARFSTWLYRIVTRCALDATRVRKRRQARETGIDSAHLEEQAAPGAEVLPVSDRLRLERILGELDPTRRAAVTLFYLQEFTVEEVASTLDLPAGTVKSHLYRARGLLRNAWIREVRGRRTGPPARRRP